MFWPYKTRDPAAGPQIAEPPGPQQSSIAGRKRRRSSEAGGCPRSRGTAHRPFPPPTKSKTPPRSLNQEAKQRRRTNISPRATGVNGRTPRTDRKRYLAADRREKGPEPKRVCLRGSSQSGEAGGCPRSRGTGQRPFPPEAKSKTPPRSLNQEAKQQRRTNISPHATGVNDRTPQTDRKRHLAADRQENDPEPKRVCLRGSSRSGEAGGCPPLSVTAERRLPPPPKRKARSRRLREDSQKRKRRMRHNTTPRDMRTTDRSHASSVVQHTAVDTQGNSMGPHHGYLLRHAVRPRDGSAPGDGVEPMEVDPPQTKQ